MPKRNISIERATDLINDGLPLVDFHIDGQINVSIIGKWEKEVTIENCIVESFRGPGTQFEKQVKFVNSHFKDCNFIGAYFSSGLLIDNCTFDNYLDFQAGGHNKPVNPIVITDSIFFDFVNFFDCWFQSDVIIKNNVFQKGTNLLGKPNGMTVTFEVNPIIENNKGQIDNDYE